MILLLLLYGFKEVTKETNNNFNIYIYINFMENRKSFRKR